MKTKLTEGEVLNDESQMSLVQWKRYLAIGIGIQNFPKGLAVSLLLKAAGFSSGY